MANEDTSLVHRGALWTLLSEMKIGERGAVRSFAEALAADQNWHLEYAERVESEYRRFLYLAATSDSEVTPSQAVDMAWHLHLTYTRHYWDILCGEILHRPLHHLPGTGSLADEQRYQSQYLATLQLYRDRFGEDPPADVWPQQERDSATDTESGESLLHPGLLFGITGIAVSLPLFALGESIFGFLFLITGALFVLFWIAARAQREKEGRDGGGCGGGGCGGGGSRGDSQDASCGTSCGGGCGGGD